MLEPYEGSRSEAETACAAGAWPEAKGEARSKLSPSAAPARGEWSLGGKGAARLLTYPVINHFLKKFNR